MSPSPLATRGFLAAGFAGALLAAALLAGCRPTPPPDPDLVATVGSHRITVADVEAELARLPGAASDPEARRTAALGALVDEAGQFELARKAGFDREPGMQRRWRQMVVREWREQALGSQETNAIPEAELQAWYQANLDRFRQAGRVRAGVIAIKVHPRAEAERRAAVRQALTDMRSAITASAEPEAAFQQCARERSEDAATRQRGGDTGWFALGHVPLRWPEEVGVELGRLATPGTLSPVIETPSGFYLLAVWEREEPSVKPFDKVREQVAHPARMAREERRSREFTAAARESAGVTLHPEALQRVRVPAAKPVLAQTSPPALPKSDPPIASQP